LKQTSKKHVGNHSLLKRLNRSIVLKFLHRREGLSRKELTTLTQLDGKTITNITQDLLRLKMIKAVGKVSRGVGRPSEIIELNPQYGFALGIDLGASHITGIAVDFTGTILARAQSTIRYGLSPSTIIKRMIAVGEKVINKLKTDRKDLLGVGVCVPGTVDSKTGIGVWAANLSKWKNVQISKPFASAFNVPVFLEESTRCAALGEMFARPNDNLNDFLLLDLSLGVGSALVQNGKLYYGHSGVAGEIGHTTIKPGGFPCRCGKQGCLEAEASGYAIARKYSETLQGAKRKTNKPDAISAQDVVDAMSLGNEICEQIFSEAARMLGTAAANAVILLNPAHLVLMGGLTRSGDWLMQPFREALRKELRPEIIENLTVEISPLGDNSGPLGAASLVLNKIFDSPGM
jgi:N-acetylglucosamine repressor